MRILPCNILGGMLRPVNQLFTVAWLVIGLAWAYQSVAKKEYAGLLLAAGFVLLAIFSFLRR
jgi:hypothetical protein